jgi:[NiFe] hydrogenase assembly HybE family chaperone
MTEGHASSPAAALQARYQAIHRDAMQGLPMLNPRLEVRALGFRHWHAHWLGALVTPWFMNLVLMPRERAHWHAIAARESRHYVFPAGVFEFIGVVDAELGDFQACSLFSPMFEFADAPSAHATALAALDALFDASCAPGALPHTPAAPSRREFLTASPRRVSDGP